MLSEEPDLELQQELSAHAASFLQLGREMLLERLLGGEFDRNGAILSVHPGAGGVDSQDWAEMLLRMYLRWAQRKGYSVKVTEYLEGTEAGIRSATLLIEGENAYGYLKAERGVHRLIRISPFDAARRRHTSFASVDVTPLVEDEVEVEIREEDLKVETFRASGAGGQYVNMTDSAVRITHIPTGIVVSCQNERSQHMNRQMALKILKAKLYERMLEERKKKLAELEGEKREISWGNQIRTYVLHPYMSVKDHRTGVETSSVEEVLDGDIDAFIMAYLKQAASKA